MRFCKIFSVLLMIILQLPLCWALPHKPNLEAIDPYFAEEIERVWLFLQTRQKHPELIMKMAILLKEMGQEKEALSWLNELKSLNIPEIQLEEMNTKIRRQYHFAIVPIFESSPQNKQSCQTIKEDTVSYSSCGSETVSQKPDAAALAAEAANDMEGAAKEYLRLYKQIRKQEYLALAAERFLWANQSHRALPLLIELSQQRTNDQELLLNIANIYGWHNDNAKKIEFLEKALALRYRRSIHKKLIEEMSSCGNVVQTIQSAVSYLTKYPNDIDINCILVQKLFEQKKDKQALQILKKIDLKKLKPAQIETLLPGVFAAKAYAEVLALCQAMSGKKIKQISKIKLQYYRAAAMLELKDLTAAEKQILDTEKILVSKHLHVDALTKNNLKLDLLLLKARIYQEMGAINQLFDVHKSILELNPFQFESLVFMGETFRNQKKLERSQYYFEQAHKIAPDNRYLLWRLAEIAILRKNLLQARLIMEKLQLMPDFKDEAMLLKLWKDTGAWKKLADYIGENSQRLLPEYKEYYIMALKELGKNKIVAKMLYDHLAKNPFDEVTEKELFNIASSAGDFLSDYQAKKAVWINNYHQRLIDEISVQIKNDPKNIRLLQERVKIYGYMNRPDLALQDLNEILKISGDDPHILEQAASMAEWAGDTTQAMIFRKRIFQIMPENASNSLRLAVLAFNKRSFVKAENYLEFAANLESIDPQAYFSAAMPVLMQAGRFAEMNKLVKKIKVSVNENFQNNTFARSLTEYERILSRDIGTVNRFRFSFMHDTDGVSLTNLQFFSRFNVKNHLFFESSVEDLAMNRENAVQTGVRARLFGFTWNSMRADKRLKCSLPFLLNKNNKLQCFVPAIYFRTYRADHEIAFDFSQTLVQDTPEAIRQGLFSTNFNVTYRKKTGNNFWIQGNAGLKKNSAGYAGSFWGITFEKALSYTPFRSLRYTFNTEDNQTENSDLFYLEDFIQTHALAYAGETNLYNARRILDSINWEIFIGLNNRNEAFHGASLRLERCIAPKIFVNAFANCYSSQNNRFKQADGYTNWNYGLFLEKREW